MEEEECRCPPPGLPAYMGTFADLMSLLMCFFVLLLSFSEMDVLKYKQIAGSMKFAFGVQNRVELKDIPKGTSVIALEFRPGRPEPTPIEIVMQQTVENTQVELDFQEGESSKSGGEQRSQGKKTGGETSESSTKEKSESDSQALAETLAQQLVQEVTEGAIEVEALGQQIVIRIKEDASFPSGSAFLQPRFWPIVQKIAQLLSDIPGEVTVSGHTDDYQTENEFFDSNWELSAQRALAVAHQMLKVSTFDHYRLVVQGLAETHPLVPNDTPENRAKNRRVEISIMQGKAKESELSSDAQQ